MDDFVKNLGAAMARHAGTGPIENPRQLSGGASQEMWRFSAPDPDQTRDFVLRRRHGGAADAGGLHGTAITMRTEAGLIAAVDGTPVPVPRPRPLLSGQRGSGAG